MTYSAIHKSQTKKAVLAQRKSNGLLASQKVVSYSGLGAHSQLHFLPLQPKLKVGSPNDKYEQEADQVAARVMETPESQVQLKSDEPTIQRMCTVCEEEESLQRMPMEEDAEIQTKRESGGRSLVTPTVQTGINRLRQSGGAALPTSTRAFMEPRFGHNFGKVKIHTGPQAVQLSKNLNARAFTVGHDIFFNQGEFHPKDRESKTLLAHELTHVIQQTSSRMISFPEMAQASHNVSFTQQVIPDSNTLIQRAPDDDSQKCKGFLGSGKLGKLNQAVREAKKRVEDARDPIATLDATTLASSTLGPAFMALFGSKNSGNLLQTVKGNVGKLADKFTTSTITSDTLNCESSCGSDILAFVPFGTEQIHICPDFFKPSFGLEGRTITVLHEVAHTVLKDEPDVYVDNRLFDVLAGLPGQPGVHNPDSLAIFISIAAKKISLTKELSKLDRPPKDKFQGFSSPQQYLRRQESFVRTVIAVADSAVDAAHREIRQTIDDFGGIASKISTESRLALLKLKTKGLLDNVTSADITSGEKTKLRQLRRKLRIIQSTLSQLVDQLDKPITVKRSTPGEVLNLDSPASETTVGKGLTLEVHDEFFISQALARSGTEAEQPVVTVKLFLSQAAKTIGISLQEPELVAFIDYLEGFVNELYKNP